MNTKELRKQFCKRHGIAYTEDTDGVFCSLRNYTFEEICELIGV